MNGGNRTLVGLVLLVGAAILAADVLQDVEHVRSVAGQAGWTGRRALPGTG